MLIDTVGFINKLPHQLVDAFKSTLEEVRTADFLLHLIDATHPHWQEQQVVVEQVLAELGAGDKPTLTVFNKLDRLSPEAAEERFSWRQFPSPSNGNNQQKTFAISALTGAGIPSLLKEVEYRLELGRELIHCELPLSAGQTMAWLRRSGKVIEEAYSETTVSVTALVSGKVAGQLRKRIAMVTAG
jgi:GTP-binding protein HflX